MTQTNKAQALTRELGTLDVAAIEALDGLRHECLPHSVAYPVRIEKYAKQGLTVIVAEALATGLVGILVCRESDAPADFALPLANRSDVYFFVGSDDNEEGELETRALLAAVQAPTPLGLTPPGVEQPKPQTGFQTRTLVRKKGA